MSDVNPVHSAVECCGYTTLEDARRHTNNKSESSFLASCFMSIRSARV